MNKIEFFSDSTKLKRRSHVQPGTNFLMSRRPAST